MMFEHDQYAIEMVENSDLVVLRGVMRMPTAAAFDTAFAAFAGRIDRGEPLRIDLAALSFLNSSGIRALATLVLRAKARGSPLALVGSATVPWQTKTLHSLAALSAGLEVQIR